MKQEEQIILYTTDSGKITVSVRFEDENFWMTQKAIAELFDTTTANINIHIKNIIEDEELDVDSTIKDFLIVQTEGGRKVNRKVQFNSLDMIIAVGYRVNSKKAINKKELSRLNRIVTMFIDYAELMAEDEVPLSMVDWLRETDTFLKNNRRKVLEGKGAVSHEDAIRKAEDIYAQYRVQQDREYISQFDIEMSKYLKGNGGKDE